MPTELAKHIAVENHRSIVLVRPLSEFADEWLDAHTNGEWFAGALVCEPRYVRDLLEGLERALRGEDDEL